MKVCILMSTYNGEKYIEEQIQSIFNQTIWQDCFLYIRDDGSKDDTRNILKKYEKLPNVKVEYGKNLGYAASFAKLLETAPESEFYSYSDQDDYWYSNKLERGIAFLEKENKNIPLMYFANCDYTDKYLNIIGKRTLNITSFTFEKALFDCWALGFTQIINKKLRDLQVLAKDKAVHDHFSEMLALAFGKQIYDTFSCAKYRRHENTITTTRNNTLKIKRELIKKLLTKNGLKNVKEYSALNENYNFLFTDKQKKLISALSKEKKNIHEKMTLIFYRGRFKNEVSKEILLRFLFLIDKI